MFTSIYILCTQLSAVEIYYIKKKYEWHLKNIYNIVKKRQKYMKNAKFKTNKKI
jgi:hypothetical protein